MGFSSYRSSQNCGPPPPPGPKGQPPVAGGQLGETGQFSVGQPGEIGHCGLTGQNGVTCWHWGSGEKHRCGAGDGGHGACCGVGGHCGVKQSGVKHTCPAETHGPCCGVGGQCGVKQAGVKHWCGNGEMHGPCSGVGGHCGVKHWWGNGETQPACNGVGGHCGDGKHWIPVTHTCPTETQACGATLGGCGAPPPAPNAWMGAPPGCTCGVCGVIPGVTGQPTPPPDATHSWLLTVMGGWIHCCRITV
ncbi:MAG: hypothetical protein M3O35_04120 [Acidobacteriota bacterium]|nr:hypothetical protein [Acidobacteriota bacterium]